MCVYAAIRVGFKRFFFWQSVIMQLYVWVLSNCLLAVRDIAAMRVGFKRFFCWQCVNMLLYVWVWGGFLWVICDYVARRVGFKRFCEYSSEHTCEFSMLM